MASKRKEAGFMNCLGLCYLGLGGEGFGLWPLAFALGFGLKVGGVRVSALRAWEFQSESF